MRPYLLFCLLCAVIGAGCKSQATLSGWKGPVEKTNINLDGQAANKIAFLEFDVTLADSLQNTYACKLASYFLQEGNLRKQRFPTDIVPAPYHIYAEILDNKGTVLTTIAHEDPLNQWVEAPGDDAGKTMAAAVLRKKTGKILIRFQYMPAAHYIRLRLPGKDARLLKPIYYAQL